MSPKSIAFLVVGMVVISSVFFIFHVTYPANPATIQLNEHPKQTPHSIKIFQHQTINYPHLGINQTSFTPTGNTSMILEGYARNATSNQPLANEKIGIAVMSAFVNVTTDSQGLYQVRILASGQGNFAFKAFQYNEKLYNVDIFPNTGSEWQNISLSPEPKYTVSGATLSHGNNLPDVGLVFTSFWGNYSLSSGQNSAYSVSVVNGTYLILAYKPGFSTLPIPDILTVNGTGKQKFDISLNSTDKQIFYLNGYLFNQLHRPVSGATVNLIVPQSSTGPVISGSNGFYNISVAYDQNTLTYGSAAYAIKSQTVVVTHNMTNHNVTLVSQDPFQFPGQGSSTIPAGMGNNTSVADYSGPLSYSIGGLVIVRQTGMPVPSQQFTVYASINGSYFQYAMTTSGGGDYSLNMAYPGQYNFTILSSAFSPTSLRISAANSLNDVPIYVNASSSQVFNISGHLLNGINNATIKGGTINLTSSTGQFLGTINVSANGTFHFKALAGKYYLNISAPGFGNISYPITVTGNGSYNITLNPTTGVVPGSSKWNPSNGSGLPGLNGSSIAGQLNSTSSGGQGTSTSSGTPVVLILQMYNGSSPGAKTIDNTPVVIFVQVNGFILRHNFTTGSNGSVDLPLAYGGTYAILPEMIQYTGQSQFVNTSGYQNTTIRFNMTELPLYNVNIDLYNTLGSYTGSDVPLSYLSSTSYLLPLTPESIYIGGNYSLVNYSLPNGTYNFSYNNPRYVSRSFNATVNGVALSLNEGLNPYALVLGWNSVTPWYYEVQQSGANIYGRAQLSGSSNEIFALQSSTYTFNAYLQSSLTGSKTFSLSSANSIQYLNYTNFQQSTALSNSNWKYSNGNSTYASHLYDSFNLSTSAGDYIYQVETNVNLSSQSWLNISSSSFAIGSSGRYFNLTNYFVTTSSVQIPITVASNGFSDILQLYSDNSVNLTVRYYVTGLTG